MTHKILLIDDSRLARMSVAKTMAALGMKLERIEAADAEEALEALERDRPDVALLDYNMPGRNGLELAKEFRRLRPQMPIAMISANHQSEVIERAAELGAEFLTKPVGPAALEDFLRRALKVAAE